MRKLVIALAVALASGAAAEPQACPFKPADGEGLAAFGQGLHQGLIAGLTSGAALDAKYKAACQLYMTLVQCGVGPNMAVTLVQNYADPSMKLIVADKLDRCK